MKRVFPVLLALLLAVSCSQSGGKIIPEGTFSKIYADMALADRWLNVNNEYKPQADTSMLYEAVFRRYGYTSEDYLASVRYYMSKPDKFSFIIERAGERLDKKADEYRAAEAKLNREQLENAQKENSQIKKSDD